MRKLPALTLIALSLTSFLLGEERPNFVFILSDDVAQGDLGIYGQELIQTPRLDELCREGTRYMEAYCGTTSCHPRVNFRCLLKP